MRARWRRCRRRWDPRHNLGGRRRWKWSARQRRGPGALAWGATPVFAAQSRVMGSEMSLRRSSHIAASSKLLGLPIIATESLAMTRSQPENSARRALRDSPCFTHPKKAGSSSDAMCVSVAAIDVGGRQVTEGKSDDTNECKFDIFDGFLDKQEKAYETQSALMGVVGLLIPLFCPVRSRKNTVRIQYFATRSVRHTSGFDETGTTQPTRRAPPVDDRSAARFGASDGAPFAHTTFAALGPRRADQTRCAVDLTLARFACAAPHE